MTDLLRKMADEFPLTPEEQQTLREAADEIERLRCPKIEKPTQPGWYWWRRVWVDKVGQWIPVQAFHDQSGAIVDKHGDMIFTDAGCEWRGPIPEPTE